MRQCYTHTHGEHIVCTGVNGGDLYCVCLRASLVYSLWLFFRASCVVVTPTVSLSLSLLLFHVCVGTSDKSSQHEANWGVFVSSVDSLTPSSLCLVFFLMWVCTSLSPPFFTFLPPSFSPSFLIPSLPSLSLSPSLFSLFLLPPSLSPSSSHHSSHIVSLHLRFSPWLKKQLELGCTRVRRCRLKRR